MQLKNIFLLILIAFTMNFIIVGVHESAHIIATQLLGRKPTWTFTSLAQSWQGDPRPQNMQGWIEVASPFPNDGVGYEMIDKPITAKYEIVITNLSGPIVGVIVSFICLYIFFKWKVNNVYRQYLLIFSFCMSILMTFYYLRSPFRLGGDESYAAAALDIPSIFIYLPIGLCYLLSLILSIWAIKKIKWNIVQVIVILFGFGVSGVLMQTVNNNIIYPALYTGNPLFYSILGYSFPVFLTDVLAVIVTLLSSQYVISQKLLKQSGIHNS